MLICLDFSRGQVLRIKVKKWERKSLSCVSTPWTILSLEFSRPEYWSGYPFLSPGDLPNSEIEPRSPTLQVDTFPAEPLRINQRSICKFEELGGWGAGLSWWKLWRGAVAWKKVSERQCFLQVWRERQFLNIPQWRKIVCCSISATSCEFRFPKRQTTRWDQRIRH